MPARLSSLKMIQVRQVEGYIGPFDLNAEGFDEG